MRLYRLGEIPWQETQGIYHALAELGQEAVVICRPSGKYACLGFHDDFEQEINTEYCQQNNIPLIRRETGGGVVLLDKDQLFFQLILSSANPLLRGRRDRFFSTFLKPAVETLRDYGLNAEVQRPADIVINGRKISGNGAGDINGYAVYIGNILLDFDRRAMSNLLKAPSAVFRNHTRLSMERHLTTLKEELAKMPDMKELEDRLAGHFKELLPEAKETVYSERLRTLALKTAERLTLPEVLQLPGRRIKARQIKIKEGVFLRSHAYRDELGRKGTAILLIDNNVICWLECSGMEHITPQAKALLSEYMAGVKLRHEDIRSVIECWQDKAANIGEKTKTETFTKWIMEGIS